MDIDNPEENFTAPKQPAEGMNLPEHVLVQLIGYMYKKIRESLASPHNIVEELFAKTSEEVRRQIRQYLIDHTNPFFGVNWPDNDTNFPWICVSNQGESESESLAMLGDNMGTEDYGTFNNDGRYSSRMQKALAMDHTTTIFIASDDSGLTLYLYHLVLFIIASNKNALTNHFDMHNIRISAQALEFDESTLPKKGHYRTVTLNFVTYFRFSLSEETSKILSLDLLVQALADGVQTVSEVPAT